jgi:Phage shock protein A (IM30), suppresses sigma54-dependent transcription
MGLWQRFTTWLKAKISRILGTMENPAETLDYSYERQLDLNRQVRKGLTDVATSKKMLEIQKSKLEENTRKLERDAKSAVAAGRDDLATIALQRRIDMQSQVSALEPQIAGLQREQDRLSDMEQQLRTKIASFKAEKEVIKAKYSAAEAKVRINEAATGLGKEMSDVGNAMQRAEEQMDEMQARSEALDELVQKGTLVDVDGQP